MMAQGVITRYSALDLLEWVLVRRQPLDKVLSNAFSDRGRYSELSDRDRAFTHLLVATVLRRMGQIDNAIDHFLERPLPARAKRLRNTLRIGAAQLLFLGTPAHAAVDATVRAGPRDKKLRGLVNAILRRLDREGRTLLRMQDAARLNTPNWLWQSWCTTFDEETARAIGVAHLSEPQLDLTLKNPTGNTIKKWAERLGAVSLPTGSLRLKTTGPIEQLSGYSEKAWWVQDAAAALPAGLFGDVKGCTVIDVCAAPGGKAAQLASQGATVIALDRSKTRLNLLRKNFTRLGLNATFLVADSTKWLPQENGYSAADAVLVDAPCTATGTIRRHPDIAHLKASADISELVTIQADLLAAASKMLKPGGMLIYTTCSLQPEEGVLQVESLLQLDARLARLPIRPTEVFNLRETVTDKGDIQTLPCHLAEHGGLDGFFISRLIRRHG